MEKFGIKKFKKTQSKMTKKIDKYGKCPSCNESWDAGFIWDVFKEMETYQDLSIEELKTKAKKCYSKPYKFSHIIGIQVQGKYDGVSYWKCPFCNTTWDKFTGDKIKLKTNK